MQLASRVIYPVVPNGAFSMAAEVEVVCPGQRLGEAGPLRAGDGTYVLRGKIYASIVGIKQVSSPDPEVSRLSCVFECGNFCKHVLTRNTIRIATTRKRHSAKLLQLEKDLLLFLK